MDRYGARPIDGEEKDLVSALKDIHPSGMKRPSKKTQDKFKRAAKAYTAKEAKMNIRIASTELAQIKARAEEEGLKYQSLVKSVLHKYVTGQLVDKGKKAG